MLLRYECQPQMNVDFLLVPLFLFSFSKLLFGWAAGSVNNAIYCWHKKCGDARGGWRRNRGYLGRIRGHAKDQSNTRGKDCPTDYTCRSSPVVTDQPSSFSFLILKGLCSLTTMDYTLSRGLQPRDARCSKRSLWRCDPAQHPADLDIANWCTANTSL